VKSANSVWLDDNFSPRNRYVNLLEKDFDAFLDVENFASPVAVEAINNWCSEHTNGKIKGIIDRLCRLLGEHLGGDDYAFPSPEAVAAAGIEGLAPIRSGFRAKYIIDAAEKISKGEIDFEKIYSSPLDDGRDELIKIKGVGEKVAQCALLYGFGKVDAFPVDVWVKRIMAEMYPDGLPECTVGVRGIAQQYLFHWRRNQ
jgi:N-glycosylase/DNA lyase